VLFTLDRYDIKTGETIENYAFAVQPIIHVLGTRQFLVCGQYCLPVYKGVAPIELERPLE